MGSKEKMIEDVEGLDVFKVAHRLVLQVYRLTSSFPKEELYGLTSQMRRASSSVVMNLVEGANRLTKREYRHFVGIARGSVGEVRYQLMLAKDLGFLKLEECKQLRGDYKRVGQMLTKLGQSLAGD